ncbi:hypothetical protein ACJZ2D_001691 [Fusarium nematophilum]
MLMRKADSYLPLSQGAELSVIIADGCSSGMRSKFTMRAPGLDRLAMLRRMPAVTIPNLNDGAAAGSVTSLSFIGPMSMSTKFVSRKTQMLVQLSSWPTLWAETLVHGYEEVDFGLIDYFLSFASSPTIHAINMQRETLPKCSTDMWLVSRRFKNLV